MRGQIKLEFIFSVVVFSVIIFYVSSQISDTVRNSMLENRKEMLIEKAESVLEWLVKQGGDENWEQNPLNAEKIGLADSPYNLSMKKIYALNNTRDENNFCILMEKFDLGGYRLVIYNSTDRLLFCGSVGIPEILVTSTKKVIIDGDYGNITLELMG